ncbi:MAG: helix-turn-helix domain-containing protein [Bacillota bacterium]
MKQNSNIINFPGPAKADSGCPGPEAGSECFASGDDYSPEKLRRELLKERKRVIQWRILNEASVILNSQLNSESLPLKIIKYAKKLVSAEAGLLALEEVKDNGLKIVKHYTFSDEAKEELIEEIVQKPQGAIEIILQKGEVINRNSVHYNPDDLYGFYTIKRNLLGIPLYAKRKIIGALLMANKSEEASFTQDDQELLMILGSQLGIALENSRLYEKIDKELQTKVDELERVNEILRKQHKILEKSLELHNQLTELVLRGKGIEAICDTLTAFIGSPVQVEDHNFQIKATTMHSITKAFVCGKELVENKEYGRQVYKLFQERKPVEIYPDIDTTQYLVPIVAGQQIMGLITTVLAHRALKQLDKVAMEQGATIIALEMLKQRAADEQTKRLKENFLEHLLEGNFESEEWVQHRALQLGLNLKNTFQIVSVEVEPGRDDKSRPELYQEIREFCAESFPNHIVTTKNNHILIMVSFNRKEKEHGVKPMVELLKERLSHLLRDGTWWIALGTSCGKLEDCLISYRNAVTSLNIMKALNLQNKIVSYDNLGIFSLIEINPQHFAEFAKRTIGPLIVYDQKHKTQLLHTLNLFYKYNSNVLKAARKGYLNPSTMKYRLRRIQEITGLDLKEPETSLQLQLAMRLTNCDCSDT